MNATSRVLLTALLCTAAVACSKKVKEVPPVDTTPPPAPVTQPVADDGMYGPGDLETDTCLRQRVIYFDFDQDNVRPEFAAAMACHAKYLRDRPTARLTLEGNADERGSREYNLGLAAAMPCRPRCRPTAAPPARCRWSATARNARCAPSPARTAGRATAAWS